MLPTFMPVATQAALKGLTPQQVESLGITLMLNNTFVSGELLLSLLTAYSLWKTPDIISAFALEQKFLIWLAERMHFRTGGEIF
jgi:hypothetical protein